MASSCVLRATGDNFQPSFFLRDSIFEPCNVFHKGERRTKSQNWENAGITIVVSSQNEFAAQVNETITFIENNYAEILRLKQFSGVENLSLDFGIQWKNGFMQSQFFPLNLINLASELSFELEVSIYTS